MDSNSAYTSNRNRDDDDDGDGDGDDERSNHHNYSRSSHPPSGQPPASYYGDGSYSGVMPSQYGGGGPTHHRSEGHGTATHQGYTYGFTARGTLHSSENNAPPTSRGTHHGNTVGGYGATPASHGSHGSTGYGAAPTSQGTHDTSTAYGASPTYTSHEYDASPPMSHATHGNSGGYRATPASHGYNVAPPSHATHGSGGYNVEPTSHGSHGSSVYSAGPKSSQGTNSISGPNVESTFQGSHGDGAYGAGSMTQGGHVGSGYNATPSSHGTHHGSDGSCGYNSGYDATAASLETHGDGGGRYSAAPMSHGTNDSSYGNPKYSHSNSLSNKSTYKIVCKKDPHFSLAVKNNNLFLTLADSSDASQHWYKDDRYSTQIKDSEGNPCFSLVNKATNMAMKHSKGPTEHVRLEAYDPSEKDVKLLWTQSQDFGEGYRTIRMVNNIKLNVDAFHGDQRIVDGTEIVLWEWTTGANQLWKIIPYCEFLLLFLFFFKIRRQINLNNMKFSPIILICRIIYKLRCCDSQKLRSDRPDHEACHSRGF